MRITAKAPKCARLEGFIDVLRYTSIPHEHHRHRCRRHEDTRHAEPTRRATFMEQVSEPTLAAEGLEPVLGRIVRVIRSLDKQREGRRR